MYVHTITLQLSVHVLDGHKRSVWRLAAVDLRHYRVLLRVIGIW